MSSYIPSSIERVISEFEKLPGVGPKSAARLVFHFLRDKRSDPIALAQGLQEMHDRVIDCSKCYNLSEESVCRICSSPTRRKDQLCIVEEPLDVIAFERSGIYNGYYFVLGGVISPADGIGPEDLRFGGLKLRINELLDETPEGLEIIFSTNPSLEGEATANHMLDQIKQMPIFDKLKVTKLAMGLSTGADLEYTDRLTLKKALDGRGEM